MGTIGFSYVGCLFLLMLFIPNLIWARNLPQGYSAKGENRLLLALERVGQVAVTCSALLFSDLNLRPWSPWSWWLAGAATLMLCYECWWVRYFRSNKTLRDFYSGFCGVPVAGATLPVLGFLLLGVYGRVPALILSVLVLGVGHIGIHLQHRRALGRPSAAD